MAQIVLSPYLHDYTHGNGGLFADGDPLIISGVGGNNWIHINTSAGGTISAGNIINNANILTANTSAGSFTTGQYGGGLWWVSFGASFSGPVNRVAHVAVFVDDIKLPMLSLQRDLGNANVIGDVSRAFGVILSAGQVIDTRIAGDGAVDTYSVNHWNFALFRLGQTGVS